jgi:hypothetical protein
MALSAIATMQVVAAEQETSAATKARMIQLISILESDPFLKEATEVRDEILGWLAEAPDVTVKVCPKVLGDIRKIKGEEGGTLVVQLMFSEAKFILEHPDKATDQHAINVGGVEGVLRTYAAMKVAKPNLAIPEFERLIEVQSAGGLGAVVDEGLKKCG